jgi:hypothetical protein
MNDMFSKFLLILGSVYLVILVGVIALSIAQDSERERWCVALGGYLVSGTCISGQAVINPDTK